MGFSYITTKGRKSILAANATNAKQHLQNSGVLYLEYTMQTASPHHRTSTYPKDGRTYTYNEVPSTLDVWLVELGVNGWS